MECKTCKYKKECDSLPEDLTCEEVAVIADQWKYIEERTRIEKTDEA